jgi:hypothetical protein
MRKAISERLGGAYVVNVAMGASAVADARNTIFLSMDLEVEAFAMQVRKDYRLAHGFNAIGYSQVRATGKNESKRQVAKRLGALLHEAI